MLLLALSPDCTKLGGELRPPEPPRLIVVWALQRKLPLATFCYLVDYNYCTRPFLSAKGRGNARLLGAGGSSGGNIKAAGVDWTGYLAVSATLTLCILEYSLVMYRTTRGAK